MALGVGLASVMNLLNPDLVVLGGGVAELGEPWLARVEQTARAEAFREVEEVCRIELALAGYDAAAVDASMASPAAARRNIRSWWRCAGSRLVAGIWWTSTPTRIGVTPVSTLIPVSSRTSRTAVVRTSLSDGSTWPPG